jgi:hypothetical protein
MTVSRGTHSQLLARFANPTEPLKESSSVVLLLRVVCLLAGPFRGVGYFSYLDTPSNIAAVVARRRTCRCGNYAYKYLVLVLVVCCRNDSLR